MLRALVLSTGDLLVLILCPISAVLSPMVLAPTFSKTCEEAFTEEKDQPLALPLWHSTGPQPQ